jgi:hypothetical protein
MRMLWIAAVACAVAGAGCAVRLGGPSPIEYQTLALPAAPGDSPADVAARISEAEARLVLLAAPPDRDSAWFAQVATATGLTQSGPGRTGPAALGFLTTPELTILGDTSIVLAAGAGRLHMHDALYEIEEDRMIDLMLVRVDSVADLRESVRSLFAYISTDVMANVPLILGLEMPSAMAADSISVLMRAYLPNANECAEQANEGTPPPASELRLFYGPVARVRCLSARGISAPGNPTTARLLVGR